MYVSIYISSRVHVQVSTRTTMTRVTEETLKNNMDFYVDNIFDINGFSVIEKNKKDKKK